MSDTLDPEQFAHEVELVRAERQACAAAVCERCQLGHAVTRKPQGWVHPAVGPIPAQMCKAGPIWERERC